MAALALAGACESKPLQPDGGMGAGGSSAGGASAGGRGGGPGDAGVCPGNETLWCLPGSGATVDYCGDFYVAPTCSGGQWVCPPGTGVPTRCRCPGLNIENCTCTSDGWQCGTGGAGGVGGQAGGAGASGRGGAGGSSGGSGGAGGDCSSPRVFCVAGSPTSCSDVGMSANCQAGQWVCPPGTIPSGQCICSGPPRPGCVCTDTGWKCSVGGSGGAGGQGGTGGQAGAAGAGGRGGASGGSGGAGGNSGACAAVTTLEACDARSDCHSVFTDPHNCACAALGCCARFSRCADGDRARCAEPPIACDALTPYCESPYTVSYTETCYEGCVRLTECGPVP